MKTPLLYQTSSPPAYYIAEDEYALSKLPSDAKLVLAPSSSIREEALTEIDRFLGHPPYLDVRKLFQSALMSSKTPSEAVRMVHLEIGEVSAAVWPEHFRDALDIDSAAVASLFIAWWPTGNADMTDDEFDKRIHELSRRT